MRDLCDERNWRRIGRSGMRIALLGVAGALAGCSPGVPFDDPAADYTQRSLTISPTTGNAQAANLAIQTTTPWPRYSQYTSIAGNGPRMVNAVQNYESGLGGAAPASAAGASTGAASAGAPSAPAPTPTAN